MSSSSKLPSIKKGSDGNISNCSTSYLEHGVEEDDADEEEDIDFNPFLKDSPSVEASSSLSSDIEVLDEDVTSQLQECTRENGEFGEETVMQVREKESGKYFNGKNCVSSDADVLDSNVARDADGSRNCFIDVDLEDAISKRTRARYSLASFTLDELETFLQETDDEDDLRNIDDEEEYKKFLAAVLQGADDDSMIRQDSENVEDEDEENDADFELELEEALESDIEENCVDDIHEEGGVSRRPETRLNRRKKSSDNQSSRVRGQANKPLRPLLPDTPIASFPTLIPKSVPRVLSAPVYNHSYGFTPQQLVQLHCLIHEHVQLLIQSYSLCVLDPSKQNIASQVKEMILAADKKRETVISQKRAQYPFFCASSLYTPSSVPLEHTQSSTMPGGHCSDSSHSDQRETLSGINSRPPHGKSRQDSFFQSTDSALQVPLVNGSILSVLDVAPLTLAGKYLEEVSIAARERHRKSIEFGSISELTKEPLFPFDNSQTLEEDDNEVIRGSTEVTPPKKTLAAVLVEKTKKQSIALVPKEIAGLAQRFFSLFNPALFPHIPPPVSVVNRLLFTDAEDELLASGMMEYNSDWITIQQCYLPCKSEHQIFVRQKNRSSSNAPDNPIKVVKKMKASPLSQEEISRIEEGLKVFKLDWMSVWKYMVPHRDPSLLPRQWRIANGTQKSYKTSDDKKKKRRLYELERRTRKLEDLARWKTSSEKEGWQTGNTGGESNSGDECIGREEEDYVHEAFLADWRPATSSPNSTSLPSTNLMQGHIPPSVLLPQSSRHVIEQLKSSGQTYQHLSASGTAKKHSRAQLGPWRGRNHRKTNARVVKLAPNLPPVNLPASVRVISLSAFRSYNTGKEVSVRSSTKITKSAQHPGESHVPKRIVHPGVSHVPGAKCVAGDKNQSDLQMHPLLFQSSGDRNLQYHPLSCGNSNSSSFNFFPHFQPQLNFSLLCNPHLENQAATNFKKSSNDITSAIGIDFHPLLQRTDDLASDSVTKHQHPQLPNDTELYRGSFSQLLTAPLGENSFPGNFTKSFDVHEKANEVDLDIHLSLSRSEFSTGNRDVHQSCEEPSSALFQKGITDNLDSSVHLLALSGNGISLCGINAGDQSLPGIVMEQEELSDSEEEIGEHVEFECEEMDDSEGDGGSDSEEIKGLSNSKDTAGTSSEKQMSSDALSLNLSSFQKNDSRETNVGMTDTKHPIEKNNLPSRPSRSCKKPPTFQNHLAGLTQSKEEIGPALDLLALNPSTRPRKSLHRSNASSSKEG